MVMDFFCCEALDGDWDGQTTSDGSASSSTKEGILECDYDTQVTKLYHLIEERKWEEVLYFLETGEWFSTSIFSIFMDPEDPPATQARTWVTALDESSSVRWCQLPLHAAVTFLAPFTIISRLVELYPTSVRCADDQDMLPLHYAFRFGAEDDVVLHLLEKFPQAISKKAVKDRLPLDLAQFGPRPERGNIIDYYMQSAVRNAKNEWDNEYEKTVTGIRNAADTDLQAELKNKSAKLVAAMYELNKTKKDLLALKRKVKAAKYAAVEGSKGNSSSHSRAHSLGSRSKSLSHEQKGKTFESDYEGETSYSPADGDGAAGEERVIQAPQRTLSSPRGRSKQLSEGKSIRSRSRSRSSGPQRQKSDEASRRSNGKKSISSKVTKKKMSAPDMVLEKKTPKRGLRNMFGLKK